MWLNSFFSKTKKNECEDTTQHTINEDKVNEDKVNEDKVKEESIKTLEKKEEKPIIEADLQEQVEHVKIEDENLPALQNKQDLNVNNENTNTKKNEEINNCKIEAVLRIIPVLEKNIQTLTKKVSCLSGLINTKQLNAKIETEQNIILNNSNLNSPNPVIEDTTTPIKEDIKIRKNSKKNKKTTKNKLSVTKKKKKNPEIPVKPETNLTETINENDQVTNPENSAQNNGKSIDQLSNYLDERLECFFTKIQSALSQIKIDKINEKCEIMVHLSGLDNKMNTNEINIDKLMSNVQQLSRKNQQEIMKIRSNMKTENNKQELQKSIDDIKMCIDYLIQPNAVDVQQTQQCTDTPITNTNTGCTSDRCVCQLINNANAANIEVINSSDGHNQIKYGDIILCEFLKAKLATEMFKRSEHQNTGQVNQFPNKIDDNKISHSSVCSKKSNRILNDCLADQIDDKKTCNTSVCSKKSNRILNDCSGNQIENNTICNTSMCSKKSNSTLNDCYGNQIEDIKICNTSVCSKKSNNVLKYYAGNQIEDNTICNTSICSKKSNNILNDCVGNQIDENRSNHSSVCSKKSNHLKNNCVQKQNKEQKMNHLPVCSKQSIHHFSKFVAENDTKLNQRISKKKCGKNQICEFLSSQPIPEWIRQSQDLVASYNPCRNPSNCNPNSSKLYNVERIVKDSRDTNNTDSTVYEITEKDVLEKNKKCGHFKEHTVVACNSFNNNP